MKTTHYLRSHVVKLFFLAIVISAQASAQTWSPVVNSSGFDAQVLSLYADTSNNILYAGGQFTTVDGITVNGIAKWDGTKWEAMGNGFGGSQPYVYWITQYKNEIYAGGPFTRSGTDTIQGIAKWNGTKWESVGGSMTFSTTLDNVAAMYEFKNELYVGGRFDSVGTQSATNLAKWDGTKWAAIGSDINDDVLVIKEHNNELYIGGFFVFAAPTGIQYRIAKWNGSKFETVGSKGLGDATKRWSVETIATYKGALYAGGYFNVLESGTINTNHIARWNGTIWKTVTGPGVGLASTSVNPVRSLVEYNGKLYVGGQFFAAGQVAAPNLATWNGSSWSNADLGTDGIINAMTIYDGSLVIVGGFTKAGGKDHKYIVKFNPTTSIGEVQQQKVFTVYPNPVTDGNIHISLNGSKTNAQYKLYSASGKVLSKGGVPADGNIHISNSLPIGSYMLSVKTEKGIEQTQRVYVLR